MREKLSKKILVLGIDGLDPRFTKKMLREGNMPNTQKLISQGAAREDLVLLGGHSTGTPPMWTTLATGCYANVHGITDFYRQSPKALDTMEYNLDSTLCKAEQVWNCFAEAGWKTLVWHWPGSSWPPTSDSPNLLVVDGSSPGNVGMSNGQVEEEYIVGASVDVDFTTYKPKAANDVTAPCVITGLQSETLVDGATSATDRLVASEFKIYVMDKAQSLAGVTSEVLINVAVSPIKDAYGWAKAPEDAKEFTLLTSGGLLRRPCLILKNADGIYDRVEIYRSKKETTPMALLPKDVFVEHILDESIVDEKRYTTNRSMRLLELKEDGTQLKMYVSAAMRIDNDKIFHPRSLHKKIMEAAGYLPPTCGLGCHDVQLTTKCQLASWQAALEWQTRALHYMIEQEKVQVIFSHFHSVDMQAHQCVAFLKDKGESRLPEKAYQGFMENIYRQADDYIGRFLHLLDEDWTILLLSDHALVCPANIPPMIGDGSGVNVRVMQELGYTVLKKDENGKELPEIDWSKTKAVANRSCNIYINLKGRDANGIVDPADKYELEEQIMTDLYGYKDKKTGKRIIAVALRNKDAVLLGYGGPECGDICYWNAEGYNWDHFDSLSTAWGEYETSVSPIFIAAGPGIKTGFVTDRIIREIDVAPTVAVLGGVRIPKQCEGAPVYQILTEDM